MNEKKQLWKGIAIGFAVTLVVIQAVMFCNSLLKSRVREEKQVNLTDEAVQEKLTEIEGLMNDYFLDELDEEQIETWLYKGAVAGLGDPYAAYYTVEEYQSLLDSTNGSYCGIGVEISQNINTGIVTVARVFEDGPAMEAGLRPGDILYKVGDAEVTGMDLTMVVSQIKGEENTKVLISVAREGEEDYLEFQVERRTIEIQTVGSAMLEDQIGYISITSFDDVTTDQFMKALDELETQGIKGLIVDLRGNGGGLVSSVCAILDRLLPEGLIVYTEDKYGNREEETSDAEHYFDKPLAVLVNGNSASASEIFAGAIKDYGIGTLVGTKTYGKGIVQKIYPLHDGTAVKLTVSKYYTPKGNNIHEIGIEPDVEIDLEEALKKEVVVPLGEDNQVQKALEVLRPEIEKQ
ncbi:MAG: S41 family peptidase [Lachnospiraceae bacterium]|uniref:S41 family peptidase n=1 Tax=Candidatus Merdisoma sp. JLR.KK011 TaxID=3114299 RepID=UPI001434E59D|nr:S41 family peptidase [Lachnospiraceae bacterium]MCI9251358.1 S41 family peptidase [Lachnospiraceae bacterium]MCI9384368.1 S41 family peptidase [Lachnospiraceae bacterium]MCI9479455.1 S41 family peptidase [Lachnospiraceae bacterium]MCI9623845.1 S41 family peptidase [Lachnospiraceae bacterium]